MQVHIIVHNNNHVLFQEDIRMFIIYFEVLKDLTICLSFERDRENPFLNKNISFYLNHRENK